MVRICKLAGKMKKTPLKRSLLIGLVGFFFLYTLLKLTGVIGTFKMSSDNMLPAYALNETVITFKWAKAGRNDVVAYYDTSLVMPNNPEAKRIVALGRIVAIGGDQMEISDGRVLINGVATEQSLPLQFYWQIAKRDYTANARRFGTAEKPQISFFMDSVEVSLEEAAAIEIQKYVPMHKLDRALSNDYMANIWGLEGETWTVNHFGPVTIPAGYLFILGDNRNNALDSRYSGYVAEKDLYGKVIY